MARALHLEYVLSTRRYARPFVVVRWLQLRGGLGTVVAVVAAARRQGWVQATVRDDRGTNRGEKGHDGRPANRGRLAISLSLSLLSFTRYSSFFFPPVPPPLCTVVRHPCASRLACRRSVFLGFSRSFSSSPNLPQRRCSTATTAATTTTTTTITRRRRSDETRRRRRSS